MRSTSVQQAPATLTPATPRHDSVRVSQRGRKKIKMNWWLFGFGVWMVLVGLLLMFMAERTP